MIRQQWLDDLSAAMAALLPRRGLLGWASALTMGMLLEDAARTAATRKGEKGKKRTGKDGGQRKGKHHGNDNHRPAKDKDETVTAAARDECRSIWPGSGKRAKRNRRHCRFIRRQCDGDDPRDFCVVYDHDSTPGRPVAVCCPEDRKCCGKRCCEKDATCCAGLCCSTGNPHTKCCSGRCINTLQNAQHCGDCNNPCTADESCVAGSCVPKPVICARGAEAEGEGDCDCPFGPGSIRCPGAPHGCCAAGATCCDGRCSDPSTDVNNCGGCGVTCRQSAWGSSEGCENDSCRCWGDWTWDESCGGCVPPENPYICCDNLGHHCPATHDCVADPPHPDGSTSYRCEARDDAP